jgi:hypothetical protein
MLPMLIWRQLELATDDTPLTRPLRGPLPLPDGERTGVRARFVAQMV